MVDRLYTVFVSSTHNDLKGVRRRIIESLWGAGFVPIAMEAQPAAADAVAAELKRRLKRSDLVVLVIGKRYGTEVPGDKDERSYTRFEYDVALELGCPVIPFLHPHANTSHNRKLKEFAKLVSDPSRHGSKRWTKGVELPGAIVNAVANAVKHGVTYGAEIRHLKGYIRVEGPIVPFVAEPRAFESAIPLFADCAEMIAEHAVTDILRLRPYFVSVELRSKFKYYAEVANWVRHVASRRICDVLAVCSKKAWGDDELNAYFEAYYKLAKKNRTVDRIFVDSLTPASAAGRPAMHKHMKKHARTKYVTPWNINQSTYKKLRSGLRKYGDMSGFVLVRAKGNPIALMVHYDTNNGIYWRTFPDDKGGPTVDQCDVLFEAAERKFEELKAHAKEWTKK